MAHSVHCAHEVGSIDFVYEESKVRPPPRVRLYRYLEPFSQKNSLFHNENEIKMLKNGNTSTAHFNQFGKFCRRFPPLHYHCPCFCSCFEYHFAPCLLKLESMPMWNWVSLHWLRKDRKKILPEDSIPKDTNAFLKLKCASAHTACALFNVM